MVARGLQWFLKAEASPQLQRSMQPRIQTCARRTQALSLSPTLRGDAAQIARCAYLPPRGNRGRVDGAAARCWNSDGIPTSDGPRVILTWVARGRRAEARRPRRRVVENLRLLAQFGNWLLG